MRVTQRIRARVVSTIGLMLFAPGIAQAINLADLIRATAESNAEIRQAEIRAGIAAIGYESVLESVDPRITASLAPVYGIGTRRGSDFAAIESITDFPPGIETTVTQSAGVGVSIEQLLPTSGSLSASASARLDAIVGEEGDATFALAPSVSLAVVQPLFTAGDLFDGRSRRLAELSSRLSMRRAETGVVAAENRVARRLASLYVQAVAAEKRHRLSERQVALAEQSVATARINAEQGGGPMSEVLRQEVALGAARSTLLQNRTTILELEHELSRLAGQAVSVVSLDDRLPAVADAASGGSTGDSPSVRTQRLALEEASARAELEERTSGATLSVNLALSPRYRDERDSPDELASAVRDFSGDGAGVDVQFSANLEVPITRRSRLAAEGALLERDLAAAQLEDTERSTAGRIRLLQRQRDIAEQRLEILRDEIDFQAGVIAGEEELLDANASTTDRVEALRLQAVALEIQLWQIEAEMLLLDMEIADLTGHNLIESVVY